MLLVRDHFIAALSNVSMWGDTDIFPLAFENHVFLDRQREVTNLLLELHKDFKGALEQLPPANQSTLSLVGYSGFRWATQLDPLWNAYLLGLVISIAEPIEKARIERGRRTVFSYRFNYDPGTHRLFNDTAWAEFQGRSLELADEFKHVLVCDIAEFYPRISHHRLKNALDQLDLQSDVPYRIEKLLEQFSGGRSYGVPIGGPAARLLSELLLNRTDRLLAAQELTFCRFADDYHIFTNSLDEAYTALASLSEKLLRNEGLALQKAKTRILTTSEFKSSSIFDPEEKGEAQGFLRMSLRYDPYSPTAEEDYEKLKAQVESFDIAGMLGREIRKSRIHTALTRKLVSAVRFLDEGPRDDTVRTLIDNLRVLAPVFPAVMLVIREVFDELSEEVQEYVCAKLRELIGQGYYLLSLELNLCFALRVLGRRRSEETEVLLAQLYERPIAHFVKRDIVLIMAKWRVTYWISDKKHYFGQEHPWIRRALLVASYTLGDEGRHWRQGVRYLRTKFEEEVLEWAKARNAQPGWEIPV